MTVVAKLQIYMMSVFFLTLQIIGLKQAYLPHSNNGTWLKPT